MCTVVPGGACCGRHGFCVAVVFVFAHGHDVMCIRSDIGEVGYNEVVSSVLLLISFTLS